MQSKMIISMRFRKQFWMLILLLFPLIVPAQEQSGVDSLEHNLFLLKRYLSKGDNWHFTDRNAERQLSGLINFIENEPLDTLVKYMGQRSADEDYKFIFRLPEHTPDSLKVPGYLPLSYVERRNMEILKRTENEFSNRPITVPGDVLDNMENEIELIPEDQGIQLFLNGTYTLPDSLKILDAIPDDMVQSPSDFQRLLRLEESRKKYIENSRIRYNDSLMEDYRIKVARQYRAQLIAQQADFLQRRLADSVKTNNYQVLKQYNDIVTSQVNDSIRQAIIWITAYADLIDNTSINLINLTDDSSPLLLTNSGNFFTRVWLKNRQNDSISVLVQNLNKRDLRLVIEDGYTFQRFRQQAVKDFDFTSLNRPSVGLDKVSNRFRAITPWTYGGDGNVGFTQTHLSNWKKGGKSAMSILLTGRGFMNYAHNKIKWDNSTEIRNGWIKPGDEIIQKNDDKFRITSRFGLSAFTKWYYSTEADFETQFFNGYKYPDTKNPISAFLSPGRFLFKIGLDYNPHKDFSLFISPLSSKTVFVKDTIKIDQTNFGISRGHTSHWEPGINTDIKYKKDIASNITFETKYRMFINYLEPRDRFEMEWESLVNVQLNDYISLRAMVHTIYDSKILFDKMDKEGNPVLNSAGQVIKEPKLQLREFVTIGFSYRINRRMVRVQEL